MLRIVCLTAVATNSGSLGQNEEDGFQERQIKCGEAYLVHIITVQIREQQLSHWIFKIPVFDNVTAPYFGGVAKKAVAYRLS